MKEKSNYLEDKWAWGVENLWNACTIDLWNAATASVGLFAANWQLAHYPEALLIPEDLWWMLLLLDKK